MTIEDGLVGKWSATLDGTPNDMVGTADGSYIGGMGTEVDTEGNGTLAYDFNGSNQEIRLNTRGVMGTLINGASQSSLSLWGKWRAFSDSLNCFATFWFAGSANLTAIRASVNQTGGDAELGARSREQDSFQSRTSTLSTTANTWHHFVFIADYANDQLRIYVDGVEFSSGVSFGASTYQHSNPTILFDAFGSFPSQTPQHFLNGRMDTIRWYDRALTQGEINQLFGGGRAEDFSVPEASVGQSDGVATVNGIGIATITSVGESNGAATASGVSISTSQSVGQSNGAATANGAAIATITAAGQSNGAATANGVVAAETGIGESNGIATAAGVTRTLLLTVGTSDGVATAAGLAIAMGSGVGQSDGVATAEGFTVSVSQAVGTSNGVASVRGIAPTTNAGFIKIKDGIVKTVVSTASLRS